MARLAMAAADPRRRILVLNNHGIRLLQQGHYRLACQDLMQSLDCVKESLKLKRPLSHENKVSPLKEFNQEHEDDLSCCSEELERLSCFASQSVALNSDDDKTSCNEASFDFYPRAFAFVPHDPTLLDVREGTSSAILYNVAMAHHLQALCVPRTTAAANKRRRHHLSKALQMYTFSLSAVQHWARNFKVHEGCHVLRLAILNNMAHVQALLGKPAEAHHTLQCLRDILGQAKPHVNAQDYSFFLANVVALCMPQGAHTSRAQCWNVAPAAAA